MNIAHTPLAKDDDQARADLLFEAPTCCYYLLSLLAACCGSLLSPSLLAVTVASYRSCVLSPMLVTAAVLCSYVASPLLLLLHVPRME